MNVKNFRALCTPAQIYFAISVVSILALLMQNLGDSKRYCIGKYSAKVPHHNMLFFVVKVVYVLVWTYLLQLLCNHGYKNVSWFILLLPFLGFFVLIGLFLLLNILK